MRFEITHQTGVPSENPRRDGVLTRLVVSCHGTTINEVGVDLVSRPSLESLRAAMTSTLPAGTVIRAVVLDESGCLQLGHPDDQRQHVGWAAVCPQDVARVLGRSPDALGWACAWVAAAKELAHLSAYARGDDYGFVIYDTADRVLAHRSGYSFYADAKVAASAAMAGLSQRVPAPRPRLSGEPISYSRTSPPKRY